MNPEEPTALEKRAREVLAESVERLDGRTLSRLTQARHAALAQLEKSSRPAWRAWVPVGTAAAAGVAALLVWRGPAADLEGPAPVVASGSAFEDIDLLADAPDFVGDAEDMEFYEWAAGEIES